MQLPKKQTSKLPKVSDRNEEFVDKLAESMSRAKLEFLALEDTHDEIQQQYQQWEDDHKRLLELNERLAMVNAESAELMAELEDKNESLSVLNKRLAEANAQSAELMVEIEEKNDILVRTNKELARANAHAAELMAIIEIKDEEIENLNRSLSKANVRGANLIADRELQMEEFKQLNRNLKREVRERKKVEAGLRENEEMIRSILESSPDAIIVTDLKGNIIECNQAAVEQYGYIKEEMLNGTNTIDLIARKHRATVKENTENVLKGGIARNVEYTLLKQDGSEFQAELSTGVIKGANGKPLYFVCISKDITERKQAEEELKITHQRLVETARIVGMAEVATGVLHNVGNVVNSVGISTSSMQETIRNSRLGNLVKVAAMLDENKDNLAAFLTTDERGQKLLTYVSAVAEHLTDEQDKLSEDLNVFSEYMQHIIEIVNLQQSYGKTAGVTELMNPADIMEDALRINTNALTRHSVEVVKEYGDLSPMQLDRHKTLQVLTNLMTNAKYALAKNDNSSKVLTLRVKTRDDDQIVFEVADNGTGIAEEDITRIFSYGFTTKKDGHGFGLHSGALAAKEMGGSLRVHSEGRGKGATFTLELPTNYKGDHNE